MRVLLGLLVVLCAGPASAQLVFEPLPLESGEEPPTQPIQGHPVRVTLDEPAESVQVVWRPNSAIPDTVALSPSGLSFVWTPTRAGVATIVTPTSAQNVSVRYSTYPGLGILVLIVAATILFGGAGFAMGRLLGDGVPAVANRADT
ncbi:MAG: hypothetical protein AAGG50_16835 [Bacteroidota bacterium]